MYANYSHMTAEEKEKLPKRREADFYPTEHGLIRAAYAAEIKYGGLKTADVILDPAAGDGRWGRIAKEMIPPLLTIPASITGIDIRNVPKPDDYALWYVEEDFRTFDGIPDMLFDLIATNPPYGPKITGARAVARIYSEQGWDTIKPPRTLTTSEWYVRKCWQHLMNYGRMMFLFPLNFMTSQDRYDNLFVTLPPTRVYALARRPSFYDGKTNSTDYGIFVWEKDGQGKIVGQPQRFETIIISHERDKEGE